MATEHIFDPYGDQPKEKRQRTWLTTCLIGCAGITLLGLILVAIIGYWISQNWRRWTATFGSRVVIETVNDSDLPVQEKKEIEDQVNRVADALRDGEISGEQLGQIIEDLTESPLLPSIVASAAEAKYIDASGLDADEKVRARVTLQRFVRGAMDGSIDEASVDEAMSHIADRNADGGWELRERVTDDELRAFLDVAKSKADEANMPEEPEPFDPSDEVKRIIDEALGEPAAELDEPAEMEEPAAEM